MKFQDYPSDQILNLISDLYCEYPNKPYATQFTQAVQQLKPEDDFQPFKMIKEIKESDPEYRKNLERLVHAINHSVIG